MFKALQIFLILLLPGITSSPMAEGELAIFNTQSRPPQDLVPLLRPLLGDQGVVSAHGDKLIVRAPANKLEEIRWLISELDRPARNLMVEVRVDRHDFAREQRYKVGTQDGRIDSEGSFFVRERGTGRGDKHQRIRTLDGRPAFIRFGQSVPIYQGHRSSNERGEQTEGFSVRYRNATRGFYVLPRLHGKQVTLELYQHDERQAPVQTGHFDIQQASSVVRGSLGEWIALGSIDEKTRAKHSGLGHSASTGSQDQRHISVRVTPLN